MKLKHKVRINETQYRKLKSNGYTLDKINEDDNDEVTIQNNATNLGDAKQKEKEIQSRISGDVKVNSEIENPNLKRQIANSNTPMEANLQVVEGKVYTIGQLKEVHRRKLKKNSTLIKIKDIKNKK